MAAQSGLGFVGKNTLLISPGIGSYTVLGEVLLSVPLSPTAPQSPRCGECRLCLDACPTEALRAPFQLMRGAAFPIDDRKQREVPVALRKQVGTGSLAATSANRSVRTTPAPLLGDAEPFPKASVRRFCRAIGSTGGGSISAIGEAHGAAPNQPQLAAPQCRSGPGQRRHRLNCLYTDCRGALLRESPLVHPSVVGCRGNCAAPPGHAGAGCGHLQTARSVESDAGSRVALDADVERLPAQAQARPPDQPLSSPCSR